LKPGSPRGKRNDWVCSKRKKPAVVIPNVTRSGGKAALGGGGKRRREVNQRGNKKQERRKKKKKKKKTLQKRGRPKDFQRGVKTEKMPCRWREKKKYTTGGGREQK